MFDNKSLARVGLGPIWGGGWLGIVVGGGGWWLGRWWVVVGGGRVGGGMGCRGHLTPLCVVTCEKCVDD